MRTGQMDRLISIEIPVEVDGPYGPQPGTPQPFLSRVWAQVQDDLPSKTETVQNGLRLAHRPARVRMRYVRGITPAMRVVVHNEVDDVYEIDSEPAELGKREWIEFTVKKYST